MRSGALCGVSGLATDAVVWRVRPPPLRQAPASEAMSGLLRASLVTPPWRMLLLSDGSVTRHLQLLTGACTLAVPVQRARACVAVWSHHKHMVLHRWRVATLALTGRRRCPRTNLLTATAASDRDAVVEVVAQETVSPPPAGESRTASTLPEECLLLEPPLVQRQARVRACCASWTRRCACAAA